MRKGGKSKEEEEEKPQASTSAGTWFIRL